MKLLRKYIREVVEDEEERTHEQKMVELFLVEPVYALHLAETAGLDPEVVGTMRSILDAAHMLIQQARTALETGETVLQGPHFHKVFEERTRFKKGLRTLYQDVEAGSEVQWGENKHKIKELQQIFALDLVEIMATLHPKYGNADETMSLAVDWAGESS